MIQTALFIIWTVLAGEQAEAPPREGSLRAALIGPEDTISIQALSADELSKTWRVSSTGDVNLPMIGKIAASGKTVDQLESEISQRLRRYVKNPHVTVHVTESRSRPVTITGAVMQPGSVQLEGPTTLFDLLAKAGGVKDPNGTLSLVRDPRMGPIPYAGAHAGGDGQFTVLELELKNVLDAHSSAANLAVQPFDRVNVMPARVAQLVHIAGEVTRPGAVELVSQDSVSLMKLLAVGGGLTRTAAAGKTIITHVNSAGVQTSMARIDLRMIMQGKAKDIELVSGDIVYVPASGWSAFVQSVSTNAVTAGLYVLARF